LWVLDDYIFGIDIVGFRWLLIWNRKRLYRPHKRNVS